MADIREFTIATSVDVNYDISAMLKQNFLRGSKFAFRVLSLPRMLGVSVLDYKKFTYLCDSLEFPGQSLTTADFRIPGKKKIRTPYMRDHNEITLSFYHSDNVPLYQIFSSWIASISPVNTYNSYFDESVAQLALFQFNDISDFDSIANTKSIKKYMKVDLIDAFPLNFTSMPANWADDGFHKLTATFFYRDIKIDMQPR